MNSDTVLLDVKNVSLSFGGNTALSNVGFTVKRGEMRAIIGPNGAGKTSMLNCISGFYRPQKGEILFKQTDLTKTPTHKIASLGIARTFQNIALYTGLSTLDNLMAARHIHMKQSAIAGAIYWGKGQREEVKHRHHVEEIIDFLEIADIRKSVVGALPYGLRKRVELGRALMLEPELLLLDEPMAGMNIEEKEDMARFILDIHERRGITIILIEHDMGLVMDIAERVVVLDFGKKIGDGIPEEIRNNEEVIRAYLGQA
ncbi:MAG: ABC transporter ATP-binding protein [Ardenticatenaceae bacterium]|nr:ABC transporter ATP-binding protein [Anaerolineales bacterium]MCB9008742.1 ABC transporter ATP-binding protein [Ardenticatenaceae bacterium]